MEKRSRWGEGEEVRNGKRRGGGLEISKKKKWMRWGKDEKRLKLVHEGRGKGLYREKESGGSQTEGCATILPSCLYPFLALCSQQLNFTLVVSLFKPVLSHLNFYLDDKLNTLASQF